MYKYFDLTHEIDVELAKWGQPANPINAQYTVQPWRTPGNQTSGPDRLRSAASGLRSFQYTP
jgi:hypothetical protein